MTTNKSDTHKSVGTMLHVHRVVLNSFDHEADLDAVVAMIENLGWKVEEIKLGDKRGCRPAFDWEVEDDASH